LYNPPTTASRSRLGTYRLSCSWSLSVVNRSKSRFQSKPLLFRVPVITSSRFEPSRGSQRNIPPTLTTSRLAGMPAVSMRVRNQWSGWRKSPNDQAGSPIEK